MSTATVSPGANDPVDATICSGELYVSNRSVTWGRGRTRAGRLEGRQDVKVEQRVLGVDGACLSMAAKDTKERMEGPFAYASVAPDSTCASLLRADGPVSAAG
jgi:hypothetical protein